MATTPSDLPSSTGGRSRLVEEKIYDIQTPHKIKKLIDTTWKSVPSDVKSSRCIGLMDVTMHDSQETHLYVIACSSTGLQDLVTGENAEFARKWNPLSIMNSRSKEILHLQCIVAPLGPSTQCYRLVPAITAVSKFTTEQQEAYWKQIENRMKNRVKILREKFNVSVLNDDQEEELKELLRSSVYGAKFKSDGLPEEDFKEIVKWHKDLIQNPEEYIKSIITDAKKSPEEHMHKFCKFCESKVKIFESWGFSPKQVKMLLETATNPPPKDKQEIVKRVEILGLRYLDDKINTAEIFPVTDPILELCLYSYCNPKHSRLADYFAQCAEDNATIALMEYLDENSSKKVTSVDWYSTGWSKEGEIAVHKDLCGVCNIRFKDRLEWLLQERERDKEDMVNSPITSQDKEDTQVSPNIEINETRNADTTTIQDKDKEGMVHTDTSKKPQVSPKIKIKETQHADTTTIPVTFQDKVYEYKLECNMDTAVAAAKRAIGLWRSNLLNTLADLIERNRDRLTQLETTDTKKSYPSEYLTNVIRCYRYFAWWASNIHGNAILKEVHGPHLCFTSHKPVVIVGQIISEDSPLLMQAWALGPALSAGNMVVLKPAQRVSRSMLHVASLIEKAGFPPGVVSIVPGDAVDIVPGDAVDKVVFMGSKVESLQVLELQEAGVGQKKVTLMQELRLNGPIIIFVFDGADLTKAVEEIEFANLLIFHNDQHPPRIYVENTICNDKSLERIQKSSRFQWYDFKDIVDATAHAATNHPSYCFAAIFTNDMKKATTMANGIHAGTICINCFDAFYAQILL